MFFLDINISNNFHQKHKEKTAKRRKKAPKKYQTLNEEEKEKKLQCHRESNKNLSEEQKRSKLSIEEIII